MHKKIRLLILLVIASFIFPAGAIPAQAAGLSATSTATRSVMSSAAKNGILTEKGKKYFYRNGKKMTGLIREGDKVYYADGKGVLQTGFRTVGGKRYYFNINTNKYEGHEGLLNYNAKFYVCVKGEVQFGNIHYREKWYISGPGGILKSGWQNVGGRYCYYWPSAGNGHGKYERAVGTVSINGKLHHFDENGFPLINFNGQVLSEYGAETGTFLQPEHVNQGPAEEPSPAPEQPSGPAEPSVPKQPSAPVDAKYFGDVSMGRTEFQKAILSCLNYYESQLQKLNNDNKFEERYRIKNSAPANIWQYSNKNPLGSYFANFDKMNSGAYKYNGKTVRYCNCDSCKWWVVQDVMHVTGTTSRDINTVWKKYKVSKLKLKDIIAKGGFSSNGKFVPLAPGTCFYNINPNGKSTHTWIYMGRRSDGTHLVFDTGHGGNISAYSARNDLVKAWEKDLSGRYHTDGARSMFRTWVNDATDTWDYEGQSIGTIWVPNDLKNFWYRSPSGKLVKN